MPGAIVKGLTPTRTDSSKVSWIASRLLDILEPGTPFMSGMPGSSATARTGHRIADRDPLLGRGVQDVR